MFIAEREGFEPPVPLSTTVFKTVVIDHSPSGTLMTDERLPVPQSQPEVPESPPHRPVCAKGIFHQPLHSVLPAI